MERRGEGRRDNREEKEGNWNWTEKILLFEIYLLIFNFESDGMEIQFYEFELVKFLFLHNIFV